MAIQKLLFGTSHAQYAIYYDQYETKVCNISHIEEVSVSPNKLKLNSTLLFLTWLSVTDQIMCVKYLKLWNITSTGFIAVIPQ